MADIRIVVAGCAGRMGRTLIKTIHEASSCAVSGGTEPEDSKHLGSDLGTLAGTGPLNITVSTDALKLIAKADAVIDFTTPEASVQYAGFCAQARIIHVIGTTGFNSGQEAAISAASRHAVIIKAGNMSLGVNLLAALTEKAAQALSDDFDIEILDIHHRDKVDAPSGTALMLGGAAARGRGVEHDKVADRGRDGHTGKRKRGHIGYAALRAGGVVGEHSVIFANDSEQIILSHVAMDRTIFAKGAIQAALWGKGRAPGLYSMIDVLGL